MQRDSEATIIIHSKRMAGWLMYRGHKLIKVVDNRKRPGFNIFIFADSDLLRTHMSEYSLSD